MIDFELEDFDLDLSAQEPEKVSRPMWYHDGDVGQSYKDIVDVALRAFEQKLRFIRELKPRAKVKVKEWKLVAAALNEAAGLNAGYLRNKGRRDVDRTIDFIASLNARLEASFKARNAGNVRPSASDRKAAFVTLQGKYRMLEQMQLSEYAKTAFEQNMAARLEAQKHSYVSLFQSNNLLREKNVELEEQVKDFRDKLSEAYQEISRLRDQLKTKSDLNMVK